MRKEAIILILFVIPLIIPQESVSQVTTGILEFHQADQTIVYNWFTYVPSSLTTQKTIFILMTGLHGNINGTYEEITEESRRLAEFKMNVADMLGYALLVPVIPRVPAYYAVAFQKECFLTSTPPFYQRPDQKVNLMIDAFMLLLKDNGYKVHKKVFDEGFSAAGQWANRYSLLHPERVKAYAAGSPGGALTLPEASYGNYAMEWPVGVHDCKNLTGSEFSQYAYRKLPHFTFVGDDDLNTTLAWAGELWTQSQIEFIEGTFGNTPLEILESQCAYLKSLGYDVTFKSYPGVEHQYTSEMARDVFTFFEPYRHTPIADAGSDQTVRKGDIVKLDASASEDPDGGLLSYLWTQATGSSVVLSSASKMEATFTAPKARPGGESLTFLLTVTDSEGLHYTDIVVINIDSPKGMPWLPLLSDD